LTGSTCLGLHDALCSGAGAGVSQAVVAGGAVSRLFWILSDLVILAASGQCSRLGLAGLLAGSVALHGWHQPSGNQRQRCENSEQTRWSELLG
jgi:hypothetical protein